MDTGSNVYYKEFLSRKSIWISLDLFSSGKKLGAIALLRHILQDHI